MTDNAIYSATGKRKRSIARVTLIPGKGKVTVNSRDFKEYFKRKSLITVILEPFRVTNTEDAYDVIVDLSGGGISGQAGALRHGISKALLQVNQEYRPVLKREGFLTRDPRIKERKKYGLKKARKKPQFSKR